jgi:hypothetical protein
LLTRAAAIVEAAMPSAFEIGADDLRSISRIPYISPKFPPQRDDLGIACPHCVCVNCDDKVACARLGDRYMENGSRVSTAGCDIRVGAIRNESPK